MKAIKFAVIAGLLLASSAVRAETGVVATVNGDKIYQKDVQTILRANNVAPADEAKATPVIIDRMINEKLLESAVDKAEIEKSEEFQKRLAQAKEELTKALFVDSYLKDKVTDKSVKAAYDKIKNENKGKQEVHARHILLKTEEEAKQVIKDLDGGAKFEELAQKRSADPTGKNGGDLGFFTKEELVPEFSKAAFDLKPGTYTKEPVKTQFGYHVIYVIEKRARAVPELKQVETLIRQKLGQEALAQLVQGLRAKADVQIFDADGNPIGGAAKDTQKN